MKLTCPSCGAVHSAEAWGNDAQARQCLKTVAEMPREVSARALAYLALFRPQSGRGLSWSKALRLLSSLQDLVARPYVQWDRKPARPNSARAWGQAMEQIIGHPPRRLPLKNHNYLRAIAWEFADQMDRDTERRKIEAERTGRLMADRPERHISEVLSSEQIAAQVAEFKARLRKRKEKQDEISENNLG